MHARSLVPRFGAERHRSSGALLLVALATALGLAFAAHFFLYYRVDWSLALWWGLKDWYLWGALAPLVIRLARRVPLRRPLWLALLIH
ncbi:MAG TPA: hypothetical protein VM779_02915, partial [Thermoanaerobaculia bacterium]|nr:hypothetical protein [Thermoanaerobaculia bacterium]